MKAQDIAKKLGYPPNARMLIVHCDDVGMSWEANAATKELLTDGIPTSCSVMMPCPWAYEFMEWYKNHSDLDVGIHVTLTSEWATYRWRPLTSSPGLLDRYGFMHRQPQAVVESASAERNQKETVAQIQHWIKERPTNPYRYPYGNITGMPRLCRGIRGAGQEVQSSPHVIGARAQSTSRASGPRL